MPVQPLWRHISRFGSTLIHVIDRRLFGAKPLPEPILSYCLLDPTTFSEISSKIPKFFLEKKPTLKCRLHHVGHFVQISMCWTQPPWNTLGSLTVTKHGRAISSFQVHCVAPYAGKYLTWFQTKGSPTYYGSNSMRWSLIPNKRCVCIKCIYEIV